MVLWQAGVLFKPQDKVSTPDVALQAPDVSLTPPPAGDLTVGLKEGNLAPDFEFSSFDGKRMRLSDLRGRPVLLNFWATWCVPCRAELPSMQDLQNRYQAQNFAVVAINDGESYHAANGYLSKLQVKLTAFGYDPKEEVAHRFGVQGLPTSYFIDGRGVIVRAVAGQLTKTIMESGAQAALGGGAKGP